MPYGDCGRKNNLMQSQKSFTTEDTENTEKTEKSKMIERQAEALVRRIGEACDELEKLAEENPGAGGAGDARSRRAQRGLPASESQAGFSR
jgi:hypothetical protein